VVNTDGHRYPLPYALFLSFMLASLPYAPRSTSPATYAVTDGDPAAQPPWPTLLHLLLTIATQSVALILTTHLPPQNLSRSANQMLPLSPLARSRPRFSPSAPALSGSSPHLSFLSSHPSRSTRSHHLTRKSRQLPSTHLAVQLCPANRPTRHKLRVRSRPRPRTAASSSTVITSTW